MKISFLTGTRADYGKIKSLLSVLKNSEKFEVDLIVTGMHLVSKYGNTFREIEKDALVDIYKIPHENYLDNNIAYSISHNTIKISELIKKSKTDLLIVHGDRAEALSGAIAALSENVAVGHIEGGEVSGTIDEMFRHSISKLAHIHFVSNDKAKQRLKLLGELDKNIFVIGSPDLDLMTSDLPSLEKAKKRYDLAFNNFGIFILHPVTTSLETLKMEVESTCDALVQSGNEHLVIYPNNDPGSEIIVKTLHEKFDGNNKFKIIPSLRFEYFLTCLKNADYIIGNSSCGVREAPFYGLPAINLGIRQDNRAFSQSIINCSFEADEILNAISNTSTMSRIPSNEFGDGNSATHFYKVMNSFLEKDIEIQKSISDVYDI
jgi:UDP-N-acetylglucosamine 2-epimerase (hydrolysing)